MSQHDYTIDNQTRIAFRADLNNALQAIASNNSGATEPSTRYVYMFWADTTTGLLKIRNAANSAWITVGTLATTNLGLMPVSGGVSLTLTGTGSAATIAMDTSDGADTKLLQLAAGGAANANRGGLIQLTGNEFSGTGGLAALYSGDVSGARALLGAGTSRLYLDRDAGLLLTPSTDSTANANNTKGFTINQDAADDHVFTAKSSDVSTGLTTGLASGLGITVETDDFLAIQKTSATTGGADILSVGESGAVVAMRLIGICGTTGTGDNTSSQGYVNIIGAEHNGSNALVNAPANANLFCIRSWSAGALATRLLLKADDGELHLGNTTLQALDGEDDISAVRGLQMVCSGGVGIVPSEFDRPAYSYEKLHALGVVGEKDEQGRFLIRVQPYLNLHDGALFQLYTMIMRQAREIAELRRMLPAQAGHE